MQKLPDYPKLIERIAKVAKMMLGPDKLKAFIISNLGGSKQKQAAITDAPIQIVNDSKSQKSSKSIGNISEIT